MLPVYFFVKTFDIFGQRNIMEDDVADIKKGCTF